MTKEPEKIPVEVLYDRLQKMEIDRNYIITQTAGIIISGKIRDPHLLFM